MNTPVFNKRNVISLLGRFPDQIDPVKRMMANKWKCSKCHRLYVSKAPVVAPAPCNECNGRFFEVIRD